MIRTDGKFKTNPLHSLRTQLVIGAVILLGLTLTSISYSLIENQKRILRTELEKTIIYQGRNIALSSEKALLRSDPEFELVPLIKRITDRGQDVSSVIIVDAGGMIQGDLRIQNVAKRFEQNTSGFSGVENENLGENEQLLERADAYIFKTPVISRDEAIGTVYMRYSKSSLTGSIHRAVTITLYCSAAAFGFGILLALLLFRRISRPMDVMMRGVNALGQGELDTRIDIDTRNEFQVLAHSFNEMASRILEAQRELVEKELVDRELEIAHDIQDTLIPATVDQPNGYEIEVYYKSAMQVGGDYVDVFAIDDSHLALVMADVSGKGIPGLVVMAMLKVMVQDLVGRERDPKLVIRRLNVSLADNIRSNMFVTLFLGILNTETGEIVYSNAGHNPLVIYDAARGEARVHRMQGPPLGVFPDNAFAEKIKDYRYRMRSGDFVVQYTDGLTESQNTHGEQFMLDRVVERCALEHNKGAREIVRSLVRAELDFRGACSQRDDLTLFAVSAPVQIPERTTPGVK